MQYDAYREKVKRVAGLLGKLYARRFIILIALVAVILTASVMVMTRGLLVLESDCPAEVTYGDRFPFRAGFVLSKTHYEHKAEGSNSWIEGKPVFPGTYSVRAYGKTSFGGKTYTETHTVTVLPRELTLTLTNTNPAYGDTPVVKAVGLAKGDKAACDVVLTDPTSATTTAYPNLSTLRVTDKKGNDRLSCYTVARPERVTVSFRPRPLTVTVQNASKVYDDTALSYDGYEITGGTLLNGDNLVAIFRDTLIDAGTKTNTPDLRVFNAAGWDVTDFYSITVKSGKLTVEKRPLIVQAGSSSFTYAGQPLDYRQYFVDQSTPLVSGHRLEVQTASTILDVGTAPNILTFAVLNRRGVEETHNYSVFVKEGTLTVTPRSVTIHTESGSLVYDGTDQSYPHVTVENGVGDEYRAVNATTRRDVGTSTNHLQVEFWRDGKNITTNYNITGYTFGTLEITPRPLSVKLNDSEKIYDATPLKGGKFTVKGPLYLPKGHTLTLETEGEVTFGSVPHTYVQNSARVTDEKGKDVTHNYDVTVTDGTLTVNPRPLTVMTHSGTKVYDGTPLRQNIWSLSSGSLLYGHELSVTLTDVSITEVGSAINTVERSLTRIYDKKTGEDVSRFYDVTYNEGTLQVLPRPLTVTTPSAQWMYDAEEHRGETAFTVTVGTLVEGHTAEIASADGAILNAGTVKNRVTLRIMNDGRDVTHNYKITYEYGDLTVTKRPITVRVLSDSFLYDGKPHTAISVRLDTTSPYTLATSRHTLQVKDTDMLLFTDAGTYINNPAVSVYDTRTGVYVTQNYEITRYEGTVTIEKRPLHIQLNGEKIYDGKLFGEDEYRIDFLNGTSPAQGHTVTARPKSVYAGESSIEQSTLTIKDAMGKDVRKNYDVTFYKGLLTVHPRPVSVVTATAEKVYDGTPLTAYTLTLAPDSMPLVEGDELFMVVSGQQTEIGRSPNTCYPETFGVHNSAGQDVTANYTLVSVTEGTLTVKHNTVVTVTTGSAEKPFDGLPLYCREYAVETTGDALPKGYAVFADVTGLITRPGSTPNTATVTVRDGEGNDVTHLFTVELRTGVLTVTDELSEGATFGRVYSDRNGRVYLRMTSYGDYNGQGWNTATPYTGTLPGGYTPNLLPAAALKTLGLTGTATLRFSGMKIFMLPYYTEINSSNPSVGSDTDYTATLRDSYTVTYYPVENPLLILEQYYKLPSYLRPLVLGNYASTEKTYRAFVEKHYLTLDGETRAFMESVIEAQGFDPADPAVIGQVAEFIRSSARYNLNYDPALDTEPNVAIAFLRDYREGVCVHYATAATLLYRALGIPARYTTGFMMEVTAGAWNDVTSPGHAWVEVYVEGLGWIQVEVTGSSDTPVDPPVVPPVDPPIDPDDPPVIPPEDRPTLTLIPAFAHKTYDGTYLTATGELVLTPELEALLALGYTYKATVSGTRLEVGESASVVSRFTLCDPNGTDVTDSFRLVKESGLLVVTPAAVEVMLYPVTKTYDGAPAVWGDGDYTVLTLPDGVTLTLAVTIPADKVGAVSLSALNRHAANYAAYTLTRNGEDVTSNYDLIFTLPDGMEETPVLTVTPRALQLTAASETRIYDGEALTNPTVYITKGSLAAGHTLIATASGTQTEIGSSANAVSSYKILDAEGRDVTSLYRVTTVDGQLTVLAVPDAGGL